MEELEKRKMGGEIVDYDRATLFPIIPGIELLYFNKDCPEQEISSKSVLKDIPSTIIVQKSSTSDFCIIYRMKKHLPVSFVRYGCYIVFLINPEQFCAVKLSPEMNEIYGELQQIPLPPTMFRLYMRLKVFEMLLRLSTVNLYSTQVHFYPYKEYD